MDLMTLEVTLSIYSFRKGNSGLCMLLHGPGHAASGDNLMVTVPGSVCVPWLLRKNTYHKVPLGCGR